MGLDNRHLFSEPEAKTKIEEVDKNFDLVLISEYFDESMVLMANLLCWPLEEVASLKMNSRVDKFKVKIFLTKSCF